MSSLLRRWFGHSHLVPRPYHLYKVTQTSAFERDDVQIGELLVYLGEKSDHYDGLWGYSFYHTRTGRECSIEFRPGEGRDFDLGTLLEHQGPDMVKPDAMADSERFSLKQEMKLELLRNDIPYFKDLVEGKPNIKNWYVWINDNSDKLISALSRVDYFRFKGEGWGTCQRLLDKFGVAYQATNRYAYLGRAMDTTPHLPR